MDLNEIMPKIAEIHNTLVEIAVRGDDAIRMANAISMCRSLAFSIQDNLNELDDGGIEMGGE